MASEPLHDHRAMDWLASSATCRIVGQVADDQLDLATPCEGWRVRDLLRHMVGNNLGFAFAARGASADPAVWAGEELPDDPRSAYDDSAEEAVAAFSELTDLTAPLDLGSYGQVPAGQAVGMHFIDYLTHGWDVAVSIGVEASLDEESCREVLRMAARWPAGHPEIWGPGAPFGYPVDVPATASAQERMLGLLGRSATWPVHAVDPS
jgi:uncharacterized protein (TIGR03086 family)